MQFLKEFGAFLLVSKRYWLLPILLVLGLLGILMLAAHGSAVAPFIYTLF